MKKYYIFIVATFIIIRLPAQSYNFYSDLVYSPLLINNNAVSGGMGEINTMVDGFTMSVSGDTNVLTEQFQNKKIDVGLSFTPWARSLTNGINCLNLASRFKLNKNVLGVSLNYVSYGEIIFTNEEGSFAGQDVPISYNLQVNFQRLLFNSLYLEVSPKYFYNEQITVVKYDVNGINVTRKLSHYYNGNFIKGSAFATDVGLHHIKRIQINQLGGIWQNGLKIYNLGTDLKHKTIAYFNNFDPAESYMEKLPTTLSLTSAFTILKNISGDLNYSFKVAYQYDRLLIPFKNDLENNGVIEFYMNAINYIEGSYELRRHNPIHKIGFEVKRMHSGKAGFSFRLGMLAEENSFDNWKYFTTGAGVNFTNLSFDLSYVMADEKNPVNRTISMTMGYCF